MTQLMQASRQWASRPSDERYTSLHALHDFVTEQRKHSHGLVVSSRRITVAPDAQDELKGLSVIGPTGFAYAPTHWSFGQLASLVGAPAGYLRTLPSPLASDAINYGLRFARGVEEIGVLLRKNGSSDFAAATGPNYGRIWNYEITSQLVDRFGDGLTGDWRVPGEFGNAVTVTKDNTTLYASDRDMFVFLADEHNRITIPNRRNGQSGSLARGFFCWNSEVGSSSFGLATFLFDYACANRIVWGAQDFRQIRLRHTAGAPDRFIEQIEPALIQYANASAKPIEDSLKAAQAKKVNDMEDFLAKRRYSKGLVDKMISAFESEEGRPPASLWDAATAITAYAKSIQYQDERVALERDAGRVLDLVAL